MSEKKGNMELANEIIDEASELPLECQECVLEIAKAMIFTRKCSVKSDNNLKEHRTA